MSISPAIAPVIQASASIATDAARHATRIPLRSMRGYRLQAPRARHRARLAGPECHRRRHRALDEAAAEHARLAVGRVVERAGLPGRHAVLAGDEIDLDAAGASAQPSRLRRPGGAHLDEDLVPAGAQRTV